VQCVIFLYALFITILYFYIRGVTWDWVHFVRRPLVGRFLKLNWHSGGWSAVGALGTAATNRPIVPAPGDYDDGEIGGMMIGRGNRSTRGNPGPAPLCSPQTPHAALTRTRAAAVGSQRLSAWATSLPNGPVTHEKSSVAKAGDHAGHCSESNLRESFAAESP
jgi:hypothetical protein